MTLLSDEKVKAAADAMRAKRGDLIALPLNRLWLELAKVAVAASDGIRDRHAELTYAEVSRR